MIGLRLKQFREYTGFDIGNIADMLGISVDLYKDIENGICIPDIDTLNKLAKYYRVTVDELYGYNPRLTLHDKQIEHEDNEVEQRVLKLSDLTWDEAQIILHYRSIEETGDGFKDDLISEIIKRAYSDKK